MERIGAVFLAGSLALAAGATGLRAAEILPREKAAGAIAVRDVAVKDGEVSGEVVNRTGKLVREVQLLVRYTWLWKNEFKPGKDDPSTAVYYTLPAEIPPGKSARFTYKPATPLPQRQDGRFEVSVALAGFTEVEP
jgi:hypothetical protein